MTQLKKAFSSQSLTHEYPSMLRTSGLSEIKLLDSQRNIMVIFNVFDGRIETFTASNKKISVIHDTFMNRIKRKLVYMFTGNSILNCKNQYIVLNDGKIIGDVIEDTLYQKIKLKCKLNYNWELENPTTENEEDLQIYKTIYGEQYCADILSSISLDLSNSYAHLHTNFQSLFELSSRSTPIF
jgi:hypothetical protein